MLVWCFLFCKPQTERRATIIDKHLCDGEWKVNTPASIRQRDSKRRSNGINFAFSCGFSLVPLSSVRAESWVVMTQNYSNTFLHYHNGLVFRQNLPQAIGNALQILAVLGAVRDAQETIKCWKFFPFLSTSLELSFFSQARPSTTREFQKKNFFLANSDELSF